MPSENGSPERLVPRLPARVWVVLAADLLSSVGSGMTLPFLVVYLHAVRGLSLPVAGALVAVVALASFAGNPLGGALTDRAGPRLALTAGLVIAAGGALALAGVGDAGSAAVAAALSGLGVSVVWPALDALLAGLTPADARSAVFGVRYATMNLGLGCGALVAATLVREAQASSYVLLYRLDAASFLVAIPLLALTWSRRERHETRAAERAAAGPTADAPGEPTADAPGEPTAGAGRATGPLAVLRGDRALRRLWVLTALLVLTGYAQFNAALPLFATRLTGLRVQQLGFVFAVNAATVVAVQLVAVRLLAGRRRTTGIVAAALTWAASWAVVLLAWPVGALAPVGALVVLAVAGALFAVGETLLAPAVPAIVNDLATDDRRGGYNAASALAYTTGFTLGPLVAGAAFDVRLGAGLPVVLAVALGLAALLAVRLRRLLPAHADLDGSAVATPTTPVSSGRPEPTQASPAPAVAGSVPRQPPPTVVVALPGGTTP